MADQEHLTLLLLGNDTWNQWREQHPEIVPFLRGAKLQRAQLREVDLGGKLVYTEDSESEVQELHKLNWKERPVDVSGVEIDDTFMLESRTDMFITRPLLEDIDLREADLDKANFWGAMLDRANFQKTNGREAIFREAYLEQANFSEADLSYADLSHAYLGKANLTGANLTGANLCSADLTGANLTGANLTGANLAGTQVTGTILTSANFTNALLTSSLPILFEQEDIGF